MAGASSYILISFHSRDVLCTLSPLFVGLGFRLFCARLARSLTKQNLTAAATNTIAW